MLLLRGEKGRRGRQPLALPAGAAASSEVRVMSARSVVRATWLLLGGAALLGSAQVLPGCGPSLLLLVGCSGTSMLLLVLPLLLLLPPLPPLLRLRELLPAVPRLEGPSSSVMQGWICGCKQHGKNQSGTPG